MTETRPVSYYEVTQLDNNHTVEEFTQEAQAIARKKELQKTGVEVVIHHCTYSFKRVLVSGVNQ